MPVMVDGATIEKGKRVQLKPGAVLQAGDDVCFQVLHGSQRIGQAGRGMGVNPGCGSGPCRCGCCGGLGAGPTLYAVDSITVFFLGGGCCRKAAVLLVQSFLYVCLGVPARSCCSSRQKPLPEAWQCLFAAGSAQRFCARLRRHLGCLSANGRVEPLGLLPAASERLNIAELRMLSSNRRLGGGVDGARARPAFCWEEPASGMSGMNT